MKSGTLSTKGASDNTKSGIPLIKEVEKSGTQYNSLVIQNYRIRRLTPLECERLQTVPDNYTNYVSNTQRYKMLGNGWTIDVIAHILSYANFKK
jgi:site-specific DNA-cytosine methylase